MKDLFMDKKKRNIIIATIFSLILTITGTTYAYFSWQSNNNPLVDITVEDMADIIFKGGNDLKATGIGPVLNYNDGEKIEFTVKKKIDNPIYAAVRVTPKILPEEFKVSYFKCKLLSSVDNKTWNEITDFDFTDKNVDTMYTIYKDTINNNLTYFKMFFYIDGRVYNSNDLQNKTFELVTDVSFSDSKCDIIKKNDDNSITYEGNKWYLLNEDDDTITMVLAYNYGTGAYGQYSTIDASYWDNKSSVKSKVNEFLNVVKIDTECLVNDATYGYARVPFKSELSTKIPNDSNTPFWTMDSIDTEYVYVGNAQGTVYEGWNASGESFVQATQVLGGDYAKAVWDRIATTSREWGPLKFYQYGYASNYNSIKGEIYVGAQKDNTVESNGGAYVCLNANKTHGSFAWFTPAYSNNTNRETMNVCTENGIKTVYLCHSLSCCKYGSPYSSASTVTFNKYSSCTKTNEYSYDFVSNVGYRPVIKVKKIKTIK